MWYVTAICWLLLAIIFIGCPSILFLMLINMFTVCLQKLHNIDLPKTKPVSLSFSLESVSLCLMSWLWLVNLFHKYHFICIWCPWFKMFFMVFSFLLVWFQILHYNQDASSGLVPWLYRSINLNSIILKFINRPGVAVAVLQTPSK